MAFLIMAVVIQDSLAALPSVTNNVDPVPLMLFVPLPLVIGLMYCLDSRLDGPEISSFRRVRLLDVGMVLVTVAIVEAISLILGHLLHSAQMTTTGRNTAFLVGMMLFVRALVGQPAVLAPVVWVVIVLLFGFQIGNEPYAWTILPQASNSLAAGTISIAVLAVGIGAQIYSRKVT
ncbi:hypothetical protein [Streptomyces sp. NPDC050548]|uniref:hypothetical protein n=1 Tax=Streptomyces sp. NPDC050548 TaxID=3365629 RepID=UPI0037984E26